jgi:tetratricopeptide (TPR) repeat protein
VLALVERAEACFEADAVPPLAAHLRAALDAPGGAKRPASSARDHYLDAVALIGEGRYRAALEPLTACTAADPGHAAAHFALGFCRQQLGQYARALERYDTAHALLPGDPRPVFNRGLVYGAQKDHARAEAEFALAITLDPAHAEAYRNRAVARLRQGREKLEGAEADLTAALDRYAAPIPVYQLRARVRELRGNAKGAEADRRAGAAYEARTEEDFLARGRAALPADPTAARTAFETALKLNPGSLAALQNLAHVWSEHERNDAKALEFLARAAERFPEHAQVRAGRAVLLARAGKRADAHAEAERALGLSGDPFVTYQVAGAFAVSAAAHPADGDRAIALLRRAIGDGFRDARTLATDTDLNPIRNRDDFKALARAANDLIRD